MCGAPAPLMLTPAGSILGNWVQETLKSQGDTTRQITEPTKGRTWLGISLPYSLSMIHTPRPVPAFMTLRPDCLPDIRERNCTNAQKIMEDSQDMATMMDLIRQRIGGAGEQ